MTPESRILHDVLLAIGGRTDVRVMRQNVGAARDPRSGRVVRFGGIVGCADVLGIIAGGRALAIEVKTATGTQSAAQRRFQRIFERYGGLYLLVRSAEDAVAQLEAALTEPAAFHPPVPGAGRA